MNGDFGIKSAIVEAAGREPEYKGSGTLVVPLYIPEGAVPIKLARIPRSGIQSFVSSASSRFSLRRARLPAVTNRRQGGPRRPISIPTVPPSFPRGWGRRIAPRATSRVGLHDDSVPSASQTEVIRAKKNQNSRLSHFTKQVTTTSTTPTPLPLTSSTITPEVTSISSSPETTTIEIVSTTKAPVIISSRKHLLVSKSSIKNDGTTELSVVITTEASPSLNSTVRIPVVNLKSYKTTKSPHSIASINARTTKAESHPTKKSFKNRTNERRPIPLPRPVQEILGHSIRTSRTSTTESPAKDIDKSRDAKSNIAESKLHRNPALTRSRNPLAARSSSVGNKDSTTKAKNSKESSNDGITKRRLPFLPRPSISSQASLERKGNNAKNSNNKPQPTNRPISKVRLPILNRNSGSTTSKPNIKSQSTRNSNTDKSSAASSLSPKILNTKTSSAPSLSVPIPVRGRRPLRPIHLPTIDANNPVPNFSSLSTVPTTMTPKLTTTSSTVRNRYTTRSSTTASTSTTVSSRTSTTTSTTTEQPLVSKNSASSTTSSIRRIHEFFKISPNRNTPSTSKPPKYKLTTENISARFITTTPPSLIYPSTHYWHRSTQRSKTNQAVDSKVSSSTMASTSKSPAEIVLASLSEVMRDATTGDKDKFREIAADLDTLNKQLAERGILIIHAEIDGKIIKLRNHTKGRNGAHSITRGGTFIKSNNYNRNNDKFNESEKENLPVQSLSGTDETITTVFTPSDKLEYDIVLKNDDDLRGSHDGTLSSTYYNVRNDADDSETLNEVSTTKLNKVTGLTTDKPTTIKRLRISDSSTNSTEPSPFLSLIRDGLLIPRLRNKSNMREKTNNDENLVFTQISSFTSETPNSGENRYISASTTIPKTITTRTRTTAVPVDRINGPTVRQSSRVESVTLSSNIENDDNYTRLPTIEVKNSHFIKPTSHMRPKLSDANEAEVILEPFPSNETLDDEALKEILELISNGADLSSNTISNEENEDPSSQSSTVNTGDSASSVYLVGMVGIFPLAGIAAYVVRKFLRGDSSHTKVLPESEERPDGFTPPSHHHPRTHSLLPVSSIQNILDEQ